MSTKPQGSGVVEPGQLVGGKYRIERLLGAGAMGAVYAAQHVTLGSSAALKFLLPQLARVPVLAERFLREGRISATLKSPHVLQVTDVDQLPNGVPYLVMEMLEGRSLQARIGQSKTLKVEEILDITLQILMGLEVAHGHEIVHRDLKPDNIFLLDHGEGVHVQILDFGIAKVRASSEFQALTRPGSMMGTPEYMAPEQGESADTADARSDLYAVGVMLYEMLSGKLPVTGNTPMEFVAKIRAKNVVPLAGHCPQLPKTLTDLVQQAIASDPADRPASAREMRLQLASHAGLLSFSGSRAAGRSIEPPPTLPSSSPPAARPIPDPTAEMQVFENKRPATTLDMPPDPGARTSSKPGAAVAVRWLAGALVLAGLLGALLVAYQRWSQRDAGAPPPMPVPPHLQ